MRRPSVFSKYVRCPTPIDLPVQHIQEQRVEVQRVICSQERLQQHPQERLQQSSGVRCIVQCDMNSPKAPQTVEVSQQQYTDMNVDVLVIWQHTDGAENSGRPNRFWAHVPLRVGLNCRPN